MIASPITGTARPGANRRRSQALVAISRQVYTGAINFTRAKSHKYHSLTSMKAYILYSRVQILFDGADPLLVVFRCTRCTQSVAMKSWLRGKGAYCSRVLDVVVRSNILSCAWLALSIYTSSYLPRKKSRSTGTCR